MLQSRLTGLNKKTLQASVVIFFIALAIPTALLIQQSYSRLKWEAFHQHQVMADELAIRIDKQLIQLINIEEQRPFTDYSFLNVLGEQAARFVQRSPLSQYPVESAIPGVIGYFQVDSKGQLMTPMVPTISENTNYYGLSATELAQRTALQKQIEGVLSENHLLTNIVGPGFENKLDQDYQRREKSSTKDDVIRRLKTDNEDKLAARQSIEAEEVTASIQGQQAFDQLNNNRQSKKSQNNALGRIEDLALSQPYKQQLEQQLVEKKIQAQQRQKKPARMEQNALPESVSIKKLMPALNKAPSALNDSAFIQQDLTSLRINTFESEVDPFEFSQLESGHFVLFRKVWLNEQRYIQGILIEQDGFLENIIKLVFADTALSTMSNLLLVYQGNVLDVFSAEVATDYFAVTKELSGELLYQTRLSSPLSEVQLLFSITELPIGPGNTIIIWLTIVLSFVLCIGFYLMYRLGLGQINLANQQQDFVSAVSHELKTPLTSIRMYAEILREGWASEDKKKSYYDFICAESERLSRLINNVLHLAKMTRNTQSIALKAYTVEQLIEGVESKVSSQIEQAEFGLKISCEEQIQSSIINVDADWFNQIMINLIDNAIKFSAEAENKMIELNCQQLTSGAIQFNIRDFGPGIDQQQMKKIFTLFYRNENELTRETVGTGIGLALVQQMTVNMKGQIDVVNKQPGAEFNIQFPC